MTRPLILASGSTARAELLRQAGVPFTVEAPSVDEGSVKAALKADDAAPRDVADVLAELKARRVASRRPEALVLGADQVLVCEGRMLDKPADFDEARAQLGFLRGKSHELLSAAVVFEDGAPVWRHVGRAQLSARPFSDAFLDAYLDMDPSVLECVGAYRLEAAGAQLFSRVQGDYFTVLGLPLLEVLGFLRGRGVCLE
jgi:septum formation protein